MTPYEPPSHVSKPRRRTERAEKSDSAPKRRLARASRGDRRRPNRERRDHTWREAPTRRHTYPAPSARARQ
eukprot:5151956-Prymnesium_polylepis.1